MHRLVRCKHEHRCSHVERNGHIINRCQNKNPRTRGCEWRHALEACVEDFGRFKKSQLSWVPGLEEDGWLLGLTETRLVALCRVHMWWGADGKVSIERLRLSPYVETFNSKVIKDFVPELRSRYMFFVFRDPYVLCIYVMNILCTFHILMYHGYVIDNVLVIWINIKISTKSSITSLVIRYRYTSQLSHSRL